MKNKSFHQSQEDNFLGRNKEWIKVTLEQDGEPPIIYVRDEEGIPQQLELSMDELIERYGDSLTEEQLKQLKDGEGRE